MAKFGDSANNEAIICLYIIPRGLLAGIYERKAWDKEE